MSIQECYWRSNLFFTFFIEEIFKFYRNILEYIVIGDTERRYDRSERRLNRDWF